MKFLHIGDNICGIPGNISRAQRESGHEATVLSFEKDKQGHEPDILIETSSRFERFRALLYHTEDVFFFVGDTPVGGVDILLWKLLGKKVVIHYHGSEVRGKGKRFFHRFADALFVSTPDLLEWVPDATWLPSPIFVQDYPQAEPDGVSVVHAPTDRELAGTEYVIDACKNLSVKLDLVEGVPYSEAIERYRHATICIEKLKTVGWYGMVGLECMAIGVPVMCYIKTELKHHLGDLPPLYCTTGTSIGKSLPTVLNTPSLLKYLSKQGKEYVTRVHNPERVVKIIDGAIE